jgi:hypothetical protein
MVTNNCQYPHGRHKERGICQYRLRSLFTVVALVPSFSMTVSRLTFRHPAPPAPPPTKAYAAVTVGKLRVTAEVVLAGTTARFLGDWSDPTVNCDAARQVVLETTLAYVPAQAAPRPPRFVSAGKTGHVLNCPQVGQGLDLSYLAQRLQLACPDGHWRPGNYNLVATVVVAGERGAPADITLSAEADLSSAQELPCGTQ